MTTSAAAACRLDIARVLREPDRAKKAAQLQYLAQLFRIKVLDVLHDKGTGHWGGAASAAELLVCLYFDAMQVRPEEPLYAERDRLLLSKGHASCMLYTVLAHRGFFPVEELDTFRQLNSRLQGHPSMHATPGVDMSTGSLGHGLSVALGMALSARVLGKSWWTYTLMGDGDLNEGQTWEAVMAAAKFRPARMVALIDYNKVQLDGPSDEIMPLDPLPEKLRAFRWNVAPEVYDGHSVAEIFRSFEWIRRQQDWPAAVIYKTHKGRGVSFMEDKSHWHGAPVDDESHARGREELLAVLRGLEANL
ncbi:MAG: transketolase [Bryobacteraceae bacterium]